MEPEKEKAIIDFVRENQPINGNVILQIFRGVSIRQLEKNGIIKYFEKDNQTGWVLDNYSPQKYSKSFDPSTVEYLIREGNILLKHKKFQQSILRFEEVIKRDKKNIDALYGLGLIYIQYKTNTLNNTISRVKKAVEYLDQILSINPKHRIALNEKKFIRVYQEFEQIKEKYKIKYNEIIVDRKNQGWNDLHTRMSGHPRLQKLREEKMQLADEILEWRENILKDYWGRSVTLTKKYHKINTGFVWLPVMDPIVPDLQISWILCKSMYQITNSASRGWLLNTSGSQTWSGGTTGEKRKNDRKKLVLEKRIRKSNKKMELNRSENAKELKEILAGLREDLKNLKK